MTPDLAFWHASTNTPEPDATRWVQRDYLLDISTVNVPGFDKILPATRTILKARVAAPVIRPVVTFEHRIIGLGTVDDMGVMIDAWVGDEGALHHESSTFWVNDAVVSLDDFSRLTGIVLDCQ